MHDVDFVIQINERKSKDRAEWLILIVCVFYFLDGFCDDNDIIAGRSLGPKLPL